MTNPGLDQVAFEAAWDAFQSTPIDLLADSDDEQCRQLGIAIKAYLERAKTDRLGVPPDVPTTEPVPPPLPDPQPPPAPPAPDPATQPPLPPAPELDPTQPRPSPPPGAPTP